MDIQPPPHAPQSLEGSALGAAERDAHRRSRGGPGFSDHRWPGKLFVVLTYFNAGLVGLGALLAPLFVSITEGYRSRLLLFVLVGAGIWAGIAAFLVVLARGVARFKQWTWWVVVIALGLCLPLAMLGAVATLLDPNVANSSLIVGLPQIALGVLFLWYFWTYRSQFRTPRVRGAGSASTLVDVS